MKDEGLYLEHILECIRKIEDYTEMDEARFMNSSMIQDAVVRNLQVMAESTQRISEKTKSENPNIEWRGIAGFRNILVHDYLGLDLGKTWEVIGRGFISRPSGSGSCRSSPNTSLRLYLRLPTLARMAINSSRMEKLAMKIAQPSKS